MTMTTATAKKRWWATQPPRRDSPPISARRAYAEVLLVFGAFFGASIVAAGFAVAGHAPTSSIKGWPEALPASIEQIATTALCVLVPLLLIHRRGLATSDLGLATPGTVRLSQGIRIAAWGLLAFMGSSVVTSLLATGTFPQDSRSIPYFIVTLFGAAQAGILEEVVVLAFVVTTLEQARRPRKEIVVVALLLRASYHIYYGPGVLGIFIWASVFLWLYLRFRTIIPLIIVHSGWDILAIVGREWHAAGGAEILAWLALLVTAMVLWLVARGTTSPPGPGAMLGPPGWYADPTGAGGMRWFTGWNWTPIASPAPPPVPTEMR